ncbi:MAG TPA: hypothetical protein VIM33_11565 [Gaiellaceae bacterium]|jgi:hypothetical protein
MFAPDDSQPAVLGRSLSDDVAEVRGLVSRPEDAFEDDLMLWHDLNHLVGILQRLSSLTS